MWGASVIASPPSPWPLASELNETTASVAEVVNGFPTSGLRARTIDFSGPSGSSLGEVS
jgi:hypothetical protein